jgi:hypothetical protein
MPTSKCVTPIGQIVRTCLWDLEQPLPTSTMTSLNLQEIRDFAIDLAKQAGTMILKASNSRLSVSSSSTAEKLNCPSPPIQV